MQKHVNKIAKGRKGAKKTNSLNPKDHYRNIDIDCDNS